MKYLDLLNAFDEWIEQNSISTCQIAIWYRLAALYNRFGRPEWVSVDNLKLMWMAQINNKNTFIKNRDKLIEFGLIEFEKGKKGKPNQYKVATEVLVNSPKKGNKFEPQIAPKTAPKVAPQIGPITEIRVRVKENTANAVQKKTACGEFKNVFLTKNELEKLESQYPQEFEAIIDYLSSYIEMKGYNAKSHYLAIQKWVVLAYREQKKREENLIRGVNYGNYSQQKPRKIWVMY
ncbi:MAG: hypothetical protein IJQ10_03050 [Clostridia bacterium]|nr:hypothetical protein [Clostridia bacterium]